MTTLSRIIIPKDTVNDDEVLITDLLFATGDQVVTGDLLLVYESSKASVEIEAEADGCITYHYNEGDYAPVGTLVAEISDEIVVKKDRPQADCLHEPTKQSATLFSKSATRYIEQKGIDPARFDGRDLVNLDDVLADEQETERDGRIPVIILGGGGHGLVLGDLVRGNPAFRVLGYLDDGKKRGEIVDGSPVLGAIPDLPALCAKQPIAALNSVGFVATDPALRLRFFQLAEKAGALLPPFVHPSASVDPRAVLGRGVQIHAGAVVGPDAIIGDGTLINTGAIISHHCCIGSHCHIAPGAVLGGTVTVADNCLVGMGVTAFVGITIGTNCIIENGTNLFRSVPANQTIKHR